MPKVKTRTVKCPAGHKVEVAEQSLHEDAETLVLCNATKRDGEACARTFHVKP